MEVDIVLNVEVRSPMADLRRTLKLGDLEDRVVKRVVNDNLLLLLVNEVLASRRGNVIERSICDGRAGLRDNCIGRKLNVLGGSVRVDLRVR